MNETMRSAEGTSIIAQAGKVLQKIFLWTTEVSAAASALVTGHPAHSATTEDQANFVHTTRNAEERHPIESINLFYKGERHEENKTNRYFIMRVTFSKKPTLEMLSEGLARAGAQAVRLAEEEGLRNITLPPIEDWDARSKTTLMTNPSVLSRDRNILKIFMKQKMFVGRFHPEESSERVIYVQVDCMADKQKK